MDRLASELDGIAKEKGIKLTEGEGRIDDVLTYALFPQVGLKFLENRDNPDAFEPAPTGKEGSAVTTEGGEEVYTVEVDGQKYTVTVSDGGDVTGLAPVGGSAASSAGGEVAAIGDGEPVPAPLGGNIVKVMVSPGDQVEEGDTLLILEAMKMESEVTAPRSGSVTQVHVKAGDAVASGDPLLDLA